MSSGDPGSTPNDQVSWFRSLGTRVFGVVTLVSLAALLAAVLATRQAGTRVGQQTATEALERSLSAQTSFQSQRLDQLALISEVFVADPNVAAYFAVSLESNDPASMLDLLEERQDDLGYDFAIALDPEGTVLVRTDRAHVPGTSLADLPLIQRALEDYGAEGVWLEGSRLFNVAVVPIANRQILEGFLMVGFTLDQATAVEIRSLSDAEIVYGYLKEEKFELVASTLDDSLDPALSIELTALLPALSAEGSQTSTAETARGSQLNLETQTIRLNGSPYLVRGARLEPQTNLWTLALSSLETQLEPFQRLGRLLTLGGLLSLLLGSGLLFVLVNRALQPLSKLAEVARQAARGNLDFTPPTEERSDEVGLLTRSLSSLLSELRERRDAELYLAELARGLPDSLDSDARYLVDAATSKTASGPPAETLDTLISSPEVNPETSDQVDSTAHGETLIMAPQTGGTQDSALQPGQTFAGRFRILGVLGEGGMGVVYKAFDLQLQEAVALKTIKEAASRRDPLWLDRLKDELKLARRVTHANVLRTHDFGVVEETAFISMEFVRGITLRSLLQTTDRIPYSAGLRIVRELLRGLEAAHDEGVLHRDIKPENLLIALNGTTKLMDFGIAQPRRPTVRTGEPEPSQGSIIGTPLYMAPELLVGQDPSEASDVYAAGLVAYEVFTAHQPFPLAPGEGMKAIMRRTREAPIPPRESAPELPEDLEAVLLRALEREPSQRLPNATAFLHELQNFRA